MRSARPGRSSDASGQRIAKPLSPHLRLGRDRLAGPHERRPDRSDVEPAHEDPAAQRVRPSLRLAHTGVVLAVFVGHRPGRDDGAVLGDELGGDRVDLDELAGSVADPQERLQLAAAVLARNLPRRRVRVVGDRCGSRSSRSRRVARRHRQRVLALDKVDVGSERAVRGQRGGLAVDAHLGDTGVLHPSRCR